MDSPSRASRASSPDPLNESAEQTVALTIPSSTAHRVTRSQQPSSLYSLDTKSSSAMKKTAAYGLYANSPGTYGFGTHTSPRKQTFHLDVGSGHAQQMIRVTVEAEGLEEKDAKAKAEKADANGTAHDSGNVSRRLFAAATPAMPVTKRRQRTTSPAKPPSAKPSRAKSPTKAATTRRTTRTPTPTVAAIATTTTTKVPLRGLSDDEGTPEDDVIATPKPRRGRPRRSGTPMPAAAEATPSSHTSPVPPGTASSAKTQQTPPPRRRSRPPRAATPRAKANDKPATAEETADELASNEATPVVPRSSVVRRTPRVTPLSTTMTTATKHAAGRRTPKRTASTVFPPTESDTESAADSIAESTIESRTDVRPRKRDRGRPRRQAMTPQEMAVIAERDDLAATTTAESASPGPASYTNNSYGDYGYSPAASPAPTMLSSVDLINVLTPARQSELGSRSHSPVPSFSPAYEEEADGDMPGADRDRTPRAPSAELDMPTAMEKQASAQNEKPLLANNATLVHSNVSTAAAPEPEDELGAFVSYGEKVGDYGDDQLFYDEAAYAADVQNSRQAMEQALLDEDRLDNIHATAVEESNAVAASSPGDVPERSPGSQRRPGSRPSSRPSSRRRSVRAPVSDSAAAESDGEVDIVSSGALEASDEEAGELHAVASHEEEDDNEELPAAASDDESDPGEIEGATVRRRDMDTIAQGEDFSMIGMESLQTSLSLSRPDLQRSDLPEMGETTSRLVSHTLASLRQSQQSQGDGLSMLDFLDQSSPSTTSTREPTQPLPVVSPRKKAEPLTKVVARKALLHEVQASPGPPALKAATEAATEAAAETAAPAETAHPQRLEEYDDSFSEIPDSVLAAVVPETMTEPLDVVPQHHTDSAADGNGAPILQQTAAPKGSYHGNVGEEGRDNDAHDMINDWADNQQQPEAEILSSPPIRKYVHHLHQATPILAPAPAPAPSSVRGLALQALQQPRFGRESRTPPPVPFLSPRFPAAVAHGGSSEQPAHRLHVPPDGVRPSLSPIVRAGRALQSVTSDPPTPKDSEGYLRSPFRRSMTRDTQSPAAAASSQHNSSTPDPQPQQEEDVADPMDDQEPAPTALPTAAEPLDDANADADAETVADPEMQQPSAVATPSRPLQSPATRPRWSSVARASLNGFKGLVANGAQILSPRLRQSASISPAASPARALYATAAVSPRKRSAADANLDEDLDEDPGGEGDEAQAEAEDAARHLPSWSVPRVKRARLDIDTTSAMPAGPPLPQLPQNAGTPSGQSGGGVPSSSRSWRARLFGGEGVAESFVGLLGATGATRGGGKRHGKSATAAAMPSEGNSTQYGSDAIMNMINDISCEDPEPGTNTSAAPAAEDDVVGNETLMAGEEGAADDLDGNDMDEDVDIWAIEADRTTRVPVPVSVLGPAAGASVPTSEPVSEPVSELVSEPIAGPIRPFPVAAAAPLRDPRLSRLLGSAGKRGVRGLQSHSPRGDEENSREYSLLENNSEAAHAAQGRAQQQQPTGRFNLDDFFSSPVAVPQLLPPTSEHNIQFNEKSRLQAMERLVEHERGRATRKRQGGEGTSLSMQTGTMEDAPGESTRNMPAALATIPTNVPFSHDKGSSLPSFVARPALSRKDVNVPQTSTAPEWEVSDESHSDAPSENDPPPELPQRMAVFVSDDGDGDSRQPTRKESRQDEADMEAAVDVDTEEQQQQRIFAASARPIRPVRPSRNVFSFSQQSSTPTPVQPRQEDNTADLFLYGAPSSPRRPLLFGGIRGGGGQPAVEMPQSPGSSLWQGRPSSLFAPLRNTAVQNFFEAPAQQQQQEEEYEDEEEEEEEDEGYADSEDELSREEPTESSSFLTPILKPLPDKSASPTKSCIRPATKPKTPGRVVEFTSSTMTAADASIVADAEAEAAALREDATFRFAEHFGLGTPNRMAAVPAVPAEPAVPAMPTLSARVPAFFSSLFTSGAVATEPPPPHSNADINDVEMMDVDDNGADGAYADIVEDAPREETPDSTPVRQSETSDLRPSRAVMHEVQPPVQQQQQKQSDPIQSSSPLTPAPPPQAAWTLDDWLVLNEVLQTYRALGPLNFKLRHLSAAPKTTTSTLLNKVVHAQQQAMLVKRWHLDIVDAFLGWQRRQRQRMLDATAVPSEAYVLRRLFSLLIGEARRGVFAGGAVAL